MSRSSRKRLKQQIEDSEQWLRDEYARDVARLSYPRRLREAEARGKADAQRVEDEHRLIEAGFQSKWNSG